MATAEGWAAEQGCSHVSLITGNLDSQRFYFKIGYSVESEERARRVLFGPSGTPAGLMGMVKARMLKGRLEVRKSILSKQLKGAAVAAAPSPSASKKGR